MTAGGEKGFSLLEVLVAFAILAVSLTVVLQSFSGALRNEHVTEGYSRAATLAESKLAEAGVSIDLGTDEQGKVEGTDLRWRLTSSPYNGEAAGPPPAGVMLYRVVSQVTWGQAPRERTLELVSLRLARE